jgi:hypothetical protein
MAKGNKMNDEVLANDRRILFGFMKEDDGLEKKPVCRRKELILG